MIIGLTGAMGAGKSTASEILASFGFTIFDADKEVHFLMDQPELIEILSKACPSCISQNKIDRSLLSQCLIEKKITLNELQLIIYPHLQRNLEKFITENPTCILDVPLLFETGWHTYCDKIIYITAPEDILRERVFQRPGMTEQKYKKLTANFIAEADKIEMSDFVIYNQYNKEVLFNKLQQIKDQLCVK
ncbi:MAG: dephospho-CoA kinase [Alphaproteobacteria bacterium]|nr:dephospho-CoA kinase [Alphaproteobacteria bacterium]